MLPVTIFVATADDTADSTSAEETLIGTGVGSVDIPANTLAVGTTIRFLLRGLLTSSSDTITLDFELDGADIDSTAVAAGAVTNNPYTIEILCTVRTIAGTGTIYCQGAMVHLAAASTVVWFTSTSTATIDTTQALTIGLTGIWDNTSVMTATNTVIELLR